MELHENQLRGAIPSELGRLSSLTKLTLRGNHLRGCIPEEWREISLDDLRSTELTVCVVLNPAEVLPAALAADRAALAALYHATDGPNWTTSTNWLSEAPPGEWHGVTTDVNGRVAELRLHDNQLRGPIPPELELLANLNLLFLNGNALHGEIPPELGQLRFLRELRLAANQLQGPIPAEFGRLFDLQLLHLGENQMSGEIPPGLGDLEMLTYLLLGGGNQFTGCIPEDVRDVPSSDLGELGLPFCKED